MKSGILYTVLLCITSMGFVGWRVYALKNQETPHFVLVEDPSLSHPKGCESLVGLAEKALSADPIRPDSTLTVMVIGDAKTANEPWQLGTYSIPTIRKVLEGRTATSQRRQDILRDISNKCQAVRRTTISPIFLGVKQAVAGLRTQGCTENSRCQLYVDSDLEENVETSIQKNLNDTTDKKRILPSPINDEGIDVVFCGLADTAGRTVAPSGREIHMTPPRNPGREDRLRQVWSSLFTNPEGVRFEPYCPNARAPVEVQRE